MIKKSKLFLLFFFIIIFGSYPSKIRAYKETKVLQCEYDAQKINLQISIPSGDINGNPTQNIEKTTIVNDKFTAQLDIIQRENKASFLHELTITYNEDDKTIKKKKDLLNWEESEKKGKATLNPVKDQITVSFSCPKYLSVNLSKNIDWKYVAASNDINELNTYGKEYGNLNDKYYILTLKTQIRDENDTCFYHSEGNDLQIGESTYSVYYNKITGDTAGYPVTGLFENEFDGSTCPPAMYREDETVNYWKWKIIETEEEAKKIYESGDRSRLLFQYRVDGDKLESSEVEKMDIRNTLIEYAEKINNDVNDFEEKCLANEDLITTVYKACVKRRENPSSKYYYDESPKRIEQAILSGISETDESITNLKKAMERYETVIKGATLKESNVVKKFYCEYQSLYNSNYMIVEKECTTGVSDACEYDFKIYESKESMKLIQDISYGEIKESGENACFDSRMIFEETDAKLNCFENIYYDYNGDKITFVNDDMMSQLRAGTPWEKKFNLIGVKQSKDSEATFENATVVNDLESIKIHNNGFMFDDDSYCVDSIMGNIECEDIFDEETKEFISFIYFIITIAAIVLTIIMSVKDYAGVIINGDQEGIKKSNGKLIKRLLLVILLLLLPAIIKFVLNIFDIPFFNSDNPTCGVQINK